MADKNIKEGDEVSWKWSGGRPGGTVAETATEGEIAITSKRGNTIKKNASADNPAVHISRPGNDVVKRASELDKEGESKKEQEEPNGAKHGRDEDDAEGAPAAKKPSKAKAGAKKQAAPKAAADGKAKAKPSKPRQKREPRPRPELAGDGIGSRTRSRAKA
ncbi:MAG: hypothetical protein M1832_006098 [Thelocarpon impressellum]|nr:MAG: hypothetical protein M1832_006098 [Thelocarpon impressellum]